MMSMKPSTKITKSIAHGSGVQTLRWDRYEPVVKNIISLIFLKSSSLYSLEKLNAWKSCPCSLILCEIHSSCVRVQALRRRQYSLSVKVYSIIKKKPLLLYSHIYTRKNSLMHVYDSFLAF